MGKTQPPAAITGTPADLANVPPPVDINLGAAQTGHLIRSFETTLGDIKDDVRAMRSDQRSDYRALITIFGGGFVLLATMLIAGYFHLDERITVLSRDVMDLKTSNVKIETKLDDLLQRLPPAITPAPKK